MSTLRKLSLKRQYDKIKTQKWRKVKKTIRYYKLKLKHRCLGYFRAGSIIINKSTSNLVSIVRKKNDNLCLINQGRSNNSSTNTVILDYEHLNSRHYIFENPKRTNKVLHLEVRPDFFICWITLPTDLKKLGFQKKIQRSSREKWYLSFNNVVSFFFKLWLFNMSKNYDSYTLMFYIVYQSLI